MTQVIIWYLRLAGCGEGIASIIRAIVAGSGRERTFTELVMRVALRRERPGAGAGQGSASMTPNSTARLIQAREVLRNRRAVVGARGWPSKPWPSLWSTRASSGLERSPIGTDHCFSQASASWSSLAPSGGSDAMRWARRPGGGSDAAGLTRWTVKRDMDSSAETLVRGAHSGHCSASQARAHSCVRSASGAGCHDAGSPERPSKPEPDSAATIRPRRNRSASALVRKDRLCWRPLSDQRAIQGRLGRSPGRC